MKRNIIITTLILLAVSLSLQAKEGMWIPSLLKHLVAKDMQEKGMRLTAEDIYSINHASLKDAVIIFGRGCTGEVVSDQGLVLTNHHCGYAAIQSHSTIEHDYLTDGFWAMNREEELSNPGLTATFLERIEDVTEQILDGVTSEMTEKKRQEIIRENIKATGEKATEDTNLKFVIKPFYYGNEYYMFLYKVYKDVRLVGAPPSNIGKFGGDTDNWMWPRHTGDFSVFRIYADENNEPAEYSESNQPYKPEKHLEISLKGIKKGDFTFVMGYPGSTEEYLPSYAIEMITQDINPVRIEMRTKVLNIMDKYMARDPKVRIQYAAKYAGVANGWKKWQGENRGIKRMDAIKRKQHLENSFMEWVSADPYRNQTYSNIIPQFETIYTKLKPWENARAYLQEFLFRTEIFRAALQFEKLVALSRQDDPDKEKIDAEINKIKSRLPGYFKDYYLPVDREVMKTLLTHYYQHVPMKYQPDYFKEIIVQSKGDFNAYVNEVFEKSYMRSATSVQGLLENYKTKHYKKIINDPAYKIANALYNHYNDFLNPEISQWTTTLDSLQRVYVNGLKDFLPERKFYPDANFTLRVTYGKVEGYEPRDAVRYTPFTTLSGVMAKEDPNIYDYVVEDKLKELYENKDYGSYANEEGQMPVCFIASNHTSGGNSGSPVLNADGQLIGLNFDRNWEGTMSDLMYDPAMCRNITLDIRYALFIIDKFAGAGHLVDEMTIAD
jgi:hypothetical protein